MAPHSREVDGHRPTTPDIDFPQDSPTYREEVDRSSAGFTSGDDFPEQDWTWGFDTVKVSFDVNPALCDFSSSLWVRSSTQNLRIDMPEAESLLGWYLLPQVDWEAKVRIDLYVMDRVCHLSFNAPRMVTPVKERLLMPDALPPLVRGLIEAIHDTVWPDFIKVTEDGEIIWDDDWSTRVRLSRLDVSRNFEVEDTQTIKLACGAISGRYQRGTVVYKSKYGWTVESPTTSVGKDKIYDKTAELSRNPADADRMAGLATALVRFETQLMRSRLKDNGLKRLSEVNGRSAWHALEARWEATGWGGPLPVRGEMSEAMTHLRPKDKLILTGYLHHAAVGDLADQTETTHRNMKRLAKECGLTVGLPVELMGKPEFHLDLRTGRQQPLSPLRKVVAQMDE